MQKNEIMELSLSMSRDSSSKRQKRDGLITERIGDREITMNKDDYKVIKYIVMQSPRNTDFFQIDEDDDEKRVNRLHLLFEMKRGKYFSFDFPEGSLSALKTLIVQNSSVRDIHPSIGLLQSLEELNISINGGPIIIPDEIGNLANLKQLNLNDNFLLDSLPPSIGKLKHLLSINLSGTIIEQLPKEFWGLVNLKRLDLQHTGIESIPSLIEGLKNLEYVDLSYTTVKKFPEKFWKLSGLRVLKLGGTPIESIPQKIGNLSNLEELHLNSARIDSLPSSIGKLKHFHHIDLSSTKIEVLPKEFWNLSGLRTLKLRETKVSIPQEIEQLRNLECLELSFKRCVENQVFVPIGVPPVEIGNLARLKSLRLNSLPNTTSLPSCMENLKQLENLYLNEHTRVELPKLDFIRKLPNLRYVFLPVWLNDSNDFILAVKYTLACNRFRRRKVFENVKKKSIKESLWPQLLSKATRAFDPIPGEDFVGLAVGFHHNTNWPHLAKLPMLEPLDALYALLREGKGCFATALIHRSPSLERQ